MKIFNSYFLFIAYHLMCYSYDAYGMTTASRRILQPSTPRLATTYQTASRRLPTQHKATYTHTTQPTPMPTTINPSVTGQQTSYLPSYARYALLSLYNYWKHFWELEDSKEKRMNDLFIGMQRYAETIKSDPLDDHFLINFGNFINTYKDIINEMQDDKNCIDILLSIFITKENNTYSEIQNLDHATDMPVLATILSKAGARPSKQGLETIQALSSKIDLMLLSNVNQKAALKELKRMVDILEGNLPVKDKLPSMINE